MNPFWVMLSLILAVVVAMIVLLIRQNRLKRAIAAIDRKLGQLTSISSLFPKFLEQGEHLTRNWTDEIDWRQSALKNLIHQADDSLSRLDHIQRDLKDSQISKTTIEEILILINQGFAVEEISRRMNLPQGEVEVAVRLRQYLNDPMVEKL